MHKLSCNVCNMTYIGETSMPLHLQINQTPTNMKLLQIIINLNRVETF